MHLLCSSPPHSSTFTPLKRLAEAARLRSRPTNKTEIMASRVAALFLLGVICAGFAAAEVPVDCCKKVIDKFVPLILIQSYTIQEAGRGCEISATVFRTKGGKTLCIIPADQKPWIRSHIKYLGDKMRAHQ